MELEPEEKFKSEVGSILAQANKYFSEENWFSLGTTVAQLWLLFYKRAQDELTFYNWINSNRKNKQTN